MTSGPSISRKIALQVKGAYLFSVCAVVLAVTPMLHATDSCNAVDSAEAEIERRSAQELSLPQKTLFANPRIDLDDRLVNLQFTLNHSSAGPGVPEAAMPIVRIAVFDLSREGYRLADGKLTEMIVDPDDAPKWRVGYSCSTGSIYHLYGFEDSDRGFNTMMSTLGLRVGSTDSALVVLSAFVALTYRDGIQELTSDRLGLLKTALDYYGGKDDTSSFLSYWRKVSAAVEQRIAPPRAIDSGGQFSVKYYVGNEEGIESVVLSMGADGLVYPQGKTGVYQWPKRK